MYDILAAVPKIGVVKLKRKPRWEKLGKLAPKNLWSKIP
jgi:hypothetical protein